MSDISVIIQGPLNEVSLDNLEYYKTLGPVIVCHWEGDDESILDNYDLSDCIVVKHPVPIKDFLLHTVSDTFIYQVKGIYYGLCEVQTPYVIRTRSDEFWGNLEPLLEQFNTNGGKVTCGNIFFRKWHAYVFHIGDHLFIGDTKILLDGYTRLIERSENFISTTNPEAIAAYGILDAVGKNRTKEDFVSVFDAIDINKLQPFLAQHRHAGHKFLNHFHVDDCVKNIGEL